MKELSKNIKEEWNSIIAKKLKAGLTLEDIAFSYAEGIRLEPNITADDISGIDHFSKTVSTWCNMAVIDGKNVSEKNQLALLALEQGANGLSIHLDADDIIEEVISGVVTEFIEIRLICEMLNDKEVQGFVNQIEKLNASTIRLVHNAHFKRVVIDKNQRIQEIRNAIARIEKDASVDFELVLGKNLFFEIASLRALRLILEQREIKQFNIIAKYDVEGTNELGDYDLIEKTYKILSGVLGGADAILTEYKGDENSRLTLNVHHVLELESGMKRVIDPVAGSYYLEKLTSEIIREVNL